MKSRNLLYGVTKLLKKDTNLELHFNILKWSSVSRTYQWTRIQKLSSNFTKYTTSFLAWDLPDSWIGSIYTRCAYGIKYSLSCTGGGSINPSTTHTYIWVIDAKSGFLLYKLIKINKMHFLPWQTVNYFIWMVLKSPMVRKFHIIFCDHDPYISISYKEMFIAVHNCAQGEISGFNAQLKIVALSLSKHCFEPLLNEFYDIYRKSLHFLFLCLTILKFIYIDMGIILKIGTFYCS